MASNSLSIGDQYSAIADWWDAHHLESDYGTAQVTRALKFTQSGGTALDVGCGSGGRLIHLLERENFDVTGLDASKKMISLAQKSHPAAQFIHGDIRLWQSEKTFDFILAWDSLFHLPLISQKPILEKLCGLVSEGGVMIHSLGDDNGEHKDEWRGQIFHYSSIGIAANLEILGQCGLSVRHVELDQYPEKHAYIISQKLPKC